MAPFIIFIFQFCKTLHLFTKHIVPQPRGWGTVLKDWILLRQNVPKGFEKYFPGGKKKPPPKDAPSGQKKPPATGKIFLLL